MLIGSTHICVSQPFIKSLLWLWKLTYSTMKKMFRSSNSRSLCVWITNFSLEMQWQFFYLVHFQRHTSTPVQVCLPRKQRQSSPALIAPELYEEPDTTCSCLRGKSLLLCRFSELRATDTVCFPWKTLDAAWKCSMDTQPVCSLADVGVACGFSP